jgi:hypothetical protein
MRLAARLLFLRSKRVLVTDLEWPAYRAILANEGARTGRELRQLSLRKAVFEERLSSERVAQMLSRFFVEHGCDGLFLSSVT